MSKSSQEKNDKRTSKQEKNFLSWGRYKTIIIAITCFLIFDLGVLAVNFYTSFQIRDDALAINLSGRQRMLSQRTVKSLLTVAIGHRNNDSELMESGRKELKLASDLFDSTLKAFIHGNTITGTENTPIYLKASEGKNSPEILANATKVWDPFFQKIQPVIDGTATRIELEDAIDYAQKNNLTILGFMNDLTNDLEVLADGRSQRLRMVQTIGIILALINFIFILFKFIRQLRVADKAVSVANEENEDILKTVHEGLFLLTPDYKIGNQISVSASNLFGQKLRPGDDFFELLTNRVSEKTLEDAQEYVALLTSEHVKEQLIQSINPLSQVEVSFKNKLGINKKHFLMLNFSRVLDKAKKLRHLLVTIQDITEKIELEAKLQEERQRSQNEFSMLLKAMEADPGELRSFIESAESRLLYVNDLLRSTSETSNEIKLQAIIDEISREIHGIKGNAAALNLDNIADIAHNFEDDLAAIKNAKAHGSKLSEELLSLPIPLGNLLAAVSMLKGIINLGPAIQASSNMALTSANISALTNNTAAIKTDNDHINPLDQSVFDNLVSSITKEYGKQTQLHITADNGWQDFSKTTSQALREITIQLVRNAIVHGIEPVTDRVIAGKSREGLVTIRLRNTNDNTWQLSVKDDGSGLDANAIREKLKTLEWYTDGQLKNMSDKQVIMHIFKPGFSMASRSSMHAGRGAGLDLIVHDMHKLSSAHLHVSSHPGTFTEFILTFDI